MARLNFKQIHLCAAWTFACLICIFDRQRIVTRFLAWIIFNKINNNKRDWASIKDVRYAAASTVASTKRYPPHSPPPKVVEGCPREYGDEYEWMHFSL